MSGVRDTNWTEQAHIQAQHSVSLHERENIGHD